jgi:tripartite-type tricarboxylate transporter receptor subunit TctC
MIAMRFLAWAFFAGPLALGADAAVAQIISGKFIRIVTSEPGSTNDWSARLIAQDLTRSLGQQTIVENRGSLAVEMFKSMAGVRLVRVPYKGTGPAVIALLGGEVHMMFSPLGSVSTHIKSGKLRALAIGNEQPSALAPGLPTVAESGLPGYEASSITGIFVPANTPAAIVSRLNQEIVRGLTRSGVREKFFDTGLEVIGGSPEDFAAKMKSEITKWSKVIREAGIREDQ